MERRVPAQTHRTRRAPIQTALSLDSHPGLLACGQRVNDDVGMDKDHQRDDPGNAYLRGLRHGYHLGRKMRDKGNRGVDREEAPESPPAPEIPLFIQQLLEIANQNGVDFE